MQLTAPAQQVVTKPFGMTVTQHSATSTDSAKQAVTNAITPFGVTLDSFEWTGMSLESNPRQNAIKGAVTGPSAGVDAALAAIDVLDFAL